jgi:hypothetical protein
MASAPDHDHRTVTALLAQLFSHAAPCPAAATAREPRAAAGPRAMSHRQAMSPVPPPGASRAWGHEPWLPQGRWLAGRWTIRNKGKVVAPGLVILPRRRRCGVEAEEIFPVPISLFHALLPAGRSWAGTRRSLPDRDAEAAPGRGRGSRSWAGTRGSLLGDSVCPPFVPSLLCPNLAQD